MTAASAGTALSRAESTSRERISFPGCGFRQRKHCMLTSYCAMGTSTAIIAIGAAFAPHQPQMSRSPTTGISSEEPSA